MQALNVREGALSFITDWWRNRKGRHATIDKLNRSGEDETTHIARDVGVSPPELRILAGKWPDSADLLSERIGAAGLQTENRAASQPQVSRDAQRDALRSEERNRRLMRRRRQWRSF